MKTSKFAVTDRVIKILQMAENCRVAHKHNSIGMEHLLDALLEEGSIFDNIPIDIVTHLTKKQVLQEYRRNFMRDA